MRSRLAPGAEAETAAGTDGSVMGRRPLGGEAEVVLFMSIAYCSGRKRGPMPGNIVSLIGETCKRFLQAPPEREWAGRRGDSAEGGSGALGVGVASSG
jgi:hypothetical protein